MDENSLPKFPLLAFTTFPIRTETQAAVLTLIETGLNWRPSHGNSALFKIHTQAFIHSHFLSLFSVFKTIKELTV